MDWQQSESWAASFEQFMSEYDELFVRSETRDKAKLYVRGLLADVERKNGWQLSESLNMANPHPLQRLLNEAKWEADKVQAQQRQTIYRQINELGVLEIDESSFIKKGRKSAGVSRQYCGRIGKVENCQVGVFLTVATSTLSAFLDYRLYVPQAWCDDEARRREAQIPDEVVFQTKPQLAQAMLAKVWQEGVNAHYVNGDSLYGNSSELRNFIHNSDHHYVLAIGSSHKVIHDGIRQDLLSLAQAIPNSQWEKLAFTLAESGWVTYEWARCRIEMTSDEIGQQWLLIRRNSPDNYDFFVSNSPVETTLSELVAVALIRHQIEQCFEEAKDQLGLADYEVRTWHGWHRHMTLCFLAHTWLTFMRFHQRQKKEFFHDG
jgi:SRSO17 transposase